MITNPGGFVGTLVNGYSYTWTDPAPTLSGVSPSSGYAAVGTSVTIGGSGFMAGAVVTFGGVAASSVVVVGASSITCVTPPGPVGPANVVVTNADTQSAILASGFTYIANLSITSVTPNVAAPGAPLTLVGTDFQAGVQVVAGGVAVTPTSVNLTQIVFPMPAGIACAPQIVVTNPNAQQASIAFNAAPAIASVVNGAGPASGGGTFLILGANFHPGTTVTVGGASATIQPLSMSSILATAPPGTVGPAAIVVTSPSGCTAVSTYIYQ